MKLRRSTWRLMTCHSEPRVLAVLIACATLLVPATLGAGLLRVQGELIDARSELEGSEHSRATVPQPRRSMRNRNNLAYFAGFSSNSVVALSARCRRSASEPRHTPWPVSWTSPMRL